MAANTAITSARVANIRYCTARSRVWRATPSSASDAGAWVWSATGLDRRSSFAGVAQVPHRTVRPDGRQRAVEVVRGWGRGRRPLERLPGVPRVVAGDRAPPQRPPHVPEE